MLPSGASFTDLTSKVVYESSEERVLGTLVYSYADRVVGRANVQMNEIDSDSYAFTERIRNDGEEEKEVSEEASARSDEKIKKNLRSIHIEINAKNIGIALGALAALVIVILLLYWMGTHSYIIRQKIAGMKSRRSERNRYQTIHDTRKSRGRGKRVKKSKNLRF